MISYSERLENLLLDMSYLLFKSRMIGLKALSNESEITNDKNLSVPIVQSIKLLQEGLSKEDLNFLLELKKLELLRIPSYKGDDLKLITICFKSLPYVFDGDYEEMGNFACFILRNEGKQIHIIFHLYIEILMKKEVQRKLISRSDFQSQIERQKRYSQSILLGKEEIDRLLKNDSVN